MPLDDLALESPWALLALLVVVASAALTVWRRRARRVPAFVFPGLALVEAVPSTAAVRLAWLPDVLRATALSLIVVALARPQLVAPPEVDDSEGIDIVIAVDTSGSMRAADFKPKDRMTVAKQSIRDFILGRKTDRLALVVFAGEAASWVPLTLDYSMLGNMLQEVEVGMIADGTAIGNALATSLNRLRDSQARSKVVVLLTDGDNNAGTIAPIKAADFAKQLGVRVYTILIGRGGPVPFPSGKDVWGRVVYRDQTIPTNPELLQRIAAKTGGEAFVAIDKQQLDSRLNQVLDNLERTRMESTARLRPYAELFPYVTLAALLVLAMELWLGSTRLRRYP